jgi:Fur family iron response transcriptional regulator|tara:strand:- start:687 stop:1142 length:456 start_codon:yes stop_codon:yes gene_type:complete
MLNKNQIFNPLSDYNKAINTLKRNSIRPTKQRMILAKLLFEKGRRHVSAEELFIEVKNDDRKISLATIYNTLRQFSQIGLIREVVVDQNKSLYCTNNESHYHLYIEDEGKIVDIPTKNIDLNIPSIPACLKLHNIDVIVKIRTLKDKDKIN